MAGVLLSPDAFARTRAAVLEWERTADPALLPTRRRGDSGRRPIRGILLEECIDNGTAEAAVTEYSDTTEVQEVSLVGEPTGGTFRLTFRGEETADIPWDATAEELQAALEALETIGANNVEVSVGTSDDYFPGVWLVEFAGSLAGVDVELMEETNNLTGVAIVVAATQDWEDTGRTATVRCAIPVGTPTPLRPGAVVLCQAMGRAGYVIWAAEARQFNPYGD